MTSASYNQPISSSICTKSILKQNKNVTSKSKDSLSCQMCAKVFETALLCKEHEKTFHNITMQIGHMCQYCNKVLSTSGNLSSHIRIKHAKTSNFMCPGCRQPFLHRRRYETHIKICTVVLKMNM